LRAGAVNPLLNIGFGSHAAMYLRHKLKGHVLDDAVLYHFPVRSLEQVSRKVRAGTEATEEIRRRKPGVADHWKRLAAAFDADANAMRDAMSVACRYLDIGTNDTPDIVAGDFRYLGGGQTLAKPYDMHTGIRPGASCYHLRSVRSEQTRPAPKRKF